MDWNLESTKWNQVSADSKFTMHWNLESSERNQDAGRSKFNGLKSEIRITVDSLT